MIRLSHVKGKINRIKNEKDEPILEGYTEIAHYLNDEFDINFLNEDGEIKNHIHKNSIEKEVANKVVEYFVGKVDTKETPPDFKERVFVAVSKPRIGITVPVYPEVYQKAINISPKHPEYHELVDKRGHVSMRANTNGMIDLSYYADELDLKEHDLQYYADWIIENYPHARQISYKEFMSGKKVNSPDDKIADKQRREIEEKFDGVKVPFVEDLPTKSYNVDEA